MTEQGAANLKVVRDALAALSAGDYPSYLGYMAADLRFHVVGAPPEADVIGPDKLWTNVLGVSTQSIGEGGFREEILSEIVDGEWVVVESRGFETTVSGERYDNEYLCFFRLRDGAIVEMRYYLDTDLTRRVKKLCA